MRPEWYRIVVGGELGQRFAPAFDGMVLEPHHGRTDIIGLVVDQAQLHGLLARVADLGLELVSVTPAGEAPRTRGVA